MDRFHNPEFTCMELYVQVTKDYNWMMSFTERLLEKICTEVNGNQKYRSVIRLSASRRHSVDCQFLTQSRRRRALTLVIRQRTKSVIFAVNELKLEEIDESFGKGKLIDEIFGEFCEGTYVQPTFITDYPVEMSPLTKMHRSKPGLTERFELMVNGKELANAYSELNDPIDQEERS